MTINVLTQGITPDIDNSIGNILIKYLSSNEYHTFTAISAFASESGIDGLAQYIEKAKESNYTKLNLIVGVDQKGTSKEALYSLLDLGINAYIFYQPGISIFHPKIYLFEGEHVSQLIVGSSNLTLHGLFTNVESSTHIELSADNPDDMAILKNLKSKFDSLFSLSDPNLARITPELIEQLVASRIVPTEAERKEIQDKIEELEGQKQNTVLSAIKEIFPKRMIPKIPNDFRRKKKTTSTSQPLELDLFANEVEAKDDGISTDTTLVWRRRKLPASSVEIAGSTNTNPTGGLRLVQDDFIVAGRVIDQTTYFRNDVFGKLNWFVQKTSPLVEVAIGRFEVIALGENLGTVALRIRHKPSGEAGQHNYTTLISWGELSKAIQERKLTNRQLNLYSIDGMEDTFRIEIL